MIANHNRHGDKRTAKPLSRLNNKLYTLTVVAFYYSPNSINYSGKIKQTSRLVIQS